METKALLEALLKTLNEEDETPAQPAAPEPEFDGEDEDLEEEPVPYIRPKAAPQPREYYEEKFGPVVKGAPVPEKRGILSREIATFLGSLAYGDSLVIPGDSIRQWRNAASRHRIGIATRRVSPTEFQLWRIK